MEKEIIIKAQGIEKTFINGPVITPVLKGIDLEIRSGEFVAIMGRSGAGKSTLLYQLSLLDRPTAGTVEIAGNTASSLSESAKTRFRLDNLGFVFQDYALVPELTATENCIMPLLMRGESFESAIKKAHQALDRVGLSGRYNNLPSMLSGGEQQRVSVARAVVGKPKILFADEPTANLDSASADTVIDLLTDLNRDGQTIVMVTHEKEYTKPCNRIIYLADGKVAKDPTAKPKKKALARTTTKTQKMTETKTTSKAKKSVAKAKTKSKSKSTSKKKLTKTVKKKSSTKTTSTK